MEVQLFGLSLSQNAYGMKRTHKAEQNREDGKRKFSDSGQEPGQCLILCSLRVALSFRPTLSTYCVSFKLTVIPTGTSYRVSQLGRGSDFISFTDVFLSGVHDSGTLRLHYQHYSRSSFSIMGTFTENTLKCPLD